MAGRVVGRQPGRHVVHVPPARRRDVLRRHAADRRRRQGQLRRHHRAAAPRRRPPCRRSAATRRRPSSTRRPSRSRSRRRTPRSCRPRRRSAWPSSAPSTLALPFDDRATSGLVGTGPFTLDHYTKDTEVVLDEARRLRVGLRRPREQGRRPPRRACRSRSSPRRACAPAPCSPSRSTSSAACRRRTSRPSATAASPSCSGPTPASCSGSARSSTSRRSTTRSCAQAIALAIDPTAVRDAALSPEFAVATSALAKTTPSWVDLSASIKSDPDAAGAALDALGWTLGGDGVREKDGQKLELALGWITNFGPNQTALELIQAQLAAVGVDGRRSKADRRPTTCRA